MAHIPQIVEAAASSDAIDELLAAMTANAEAPEADAAPPTQPILVFDDIVADLLSTKPVGDAVDRASDWSHAVLKLAAAEMRRPERAERATGPRLVELRHVAA